MSITFFFFISFILLSILFFLPALFPRCSCCKKFKPRPFFKLHASVKIGLGYSVNSSVCSKCSIRYNINSLDDLKRLKEIKRKIETNI